MYSKIEKPHIIGTIILISIAATLFLITGCEKDDPVELPELSTVPPSDIGSSSAVSGGYITDDGGSPVTDRGIVWSSAGNPTLENNEGILSAGEGAGRYLLKMENLKPETEYHIRAYAINSLGENYGDEITFTTLHESATGRAITDIDGNQYNTIVIDDKEWMTENLRVTRYQTGEDIHTGLDNEYWGLTTAGAYAIYPHDDIEGIGSAGEMTEAYGLLYNWYTVEQGLLCPTGWRVPTEEDWDGLTDYLIDNYADINSSNVGNYLKSCRQEDSPLGGECDTSEHPRWRSDDIHSGTDDFGFSALPGGNRNFRGQFEYIGEYGYWWTADEGGEFFAWLRVMGYNTGNVTTSSLQKQHGMSVRCLRDID